LIVESSKPVVYLLHGEDEFGIATAINLIRTKLGDPTISVMNTTQLDGRSVSLSELEAEVCVMPLIAERRLVILTNPTSGLKSPSQRKKFKEILDKIPPTTGLVLVEYHILKGEKKPHWLVAWARGAGERAYVKDYPIKGESDMVNWITNRAKEHGGEITIQAAVSLSELMGEDQRMADQEISKLLTYVNYSRPVEIDDVEKLTPDASIVQAFALVDAIRESKTQKAQAVLQRMLVDDDPIRILGSIVYNYRNLLLGREVIDNGGGKNQVIVELGKLKIHPYPASLAFNHARGLKIDSLESKYHQLLEYDTLVKTGQMPGDLALDILVIKLTS
jgi:DNA polymerase-3 subunit delta